MDYIGNNMTITDRNITGINTIDTLQYKINNGYISITFTGDTWSGFAFRK